jgi:6-phosphogluconolactonase
MKTSLKRILAPHLVLFGFTLLTASVHAQSTFVYTNNSAYPNSVSAFSVGSSGTLNPVGTFPTGGTAALSFEYAADRITTTRRFLYASNNYSSDISAFSINTTTGVLTAVPGSPFAAGGYGLYGISLAATPNGRFLYAGNFLSGNISAFTIAHHGALTPIAGYFSSPGLPDGINVSPDGRFLAVALPVSGPGAAKAGVAMFSIGSTGALTPVPGSPFPVPGGGASYVDIKCKSNLLFATHSTPGRFSPGDGPPTVSVFTIASDGALTEITGSPFTFVGDSLFSPGVLSPDDRHLFVSSEYSDTITSLNVASGGSLTQAIGSPFHDPGATFPFGMATNRAGTLLYVASGAGVTGFSIARNGGLSPVPGSPFSTSADVRSLTVFPPKSCEDDAGADE